MGHKSGHIIRTKGWGTHAQIRTKGQRDTCTDSDKGTGGHMHRFGHRDIIFTKGHFVLWHSGGPSSQTRGYLDQDLPGHHII